MTLPRDQSGAELFFFFLPQSGSVSVLILPPLQAGSCKMVFVKWSHRPFLGHISGENTSHDSGKASGGSYGPVKGEEGRTAQQGRISIHSL